MHWKFRGRHLGFSKRVCNDLLHVSETKLSLGDIIATEMHASDDTITNISIRNEVRNVTRTILRAEQDDISKQCKSNLKKIWNYIKTKNVDSIGDIKYVLDNGLECLAKTDEEKANVFCNYFSSVFNVET